MTGQEEPSMAEMYFTAGFIMGAADRISDGWIKQTLNTVGNWLQKEGDKREVINK